jgi:hypothetical protein
MILDPEVNDEENTPEEWQPLADTDIIRIDLQGVNSTHSNNREYSTKLGRIYLSIPRRCKANSYTCPSLLYHKWGNSPRGFCRLVVSTVNEIYSFLA